MRTHKITTILMLLVACIAAGNTYAQTLVDRVAIIVNDESILQSEVQDRLNQLEAQIESQGAQLPPASVLMPQLLERIVVDSIQDQMADRYQIKVSDADVNEIDGIKFSWHDRWIHLRSSNTEPIMRIYAEGPTKAEAQGLIDQIRSKL